MRASTCVGVLSERARERDEVVGAQRDRLAGLRLAEPGDDPDVGAEHFVGVVGVERARLVADDDAVRRRLGPARGSANCAVRSSP